MQGPLGWRTRDGRADERAGSHGEGGGAETGGGLAFPHGDHPQSLLHAGEAVASGVKYVIRTDVFAV